MPGDDSDWWWESQAWEDYLNDMAYGGGGGGGSGSGSTASIAKLRMLIPNFRKDEDRFLWEKYPDNLCFARAEIIHNDLIDAGYDAEYILVDELSYHGWNYHVAVVVTIDGEIWVVDPLFSNEPMTVSAWKDALGVKPEYNPQITPYNPKLQDIPDANNERIRDTQNGFYIPAWTSHEDFCEKYIKAYDQHQKMKERERRERIRRYFEP